MEYTTRTVINTLKNYSKISELKFYKADMNSCDLLIDVDMVLELANLTVKQRKIVDMLWKQSYSQCEVAEAMGISQPMVFKHIRYITVKIERVLKEWEKGVEQDGNNVAV